MIDCYTHRRLMLMRGRLPSAGLTLNIGGGGNPYMVARGCRNVTVDIENLTLKDYIRASAEKLPFGNGVFDNVLLFDVLEHVVDDAAAVRESWRVLRAGGMLYATIPCRQDDFFRVEFPRFLKKTDWPDMEKKWGHVRRGYTSEEVRNLFGGYFDLVHLERGCANFARIALQFYFLRGWERLWFRSAAVRGFLKALNYMDDWCCRGKGHCIFAIFRRGERGDARRKAPPGCGIAAKE